MCLKERPHRWSLDVLGVRPPSKSPSVYIDVSRRILPGNSGQPSQCFEYDERMRGCSGEDGGRWVPFVRLGRRGCAFWDGSTGATKVH